MKVSARPLRESPRDDSGLPLLENSAGAIPISKYETASDNVSLPWSFYKISGLVLEYRLNLVHHGAHPFLRFRAGQRLTHGNLGQECHVALLPG